MKLCSLNSLHFLYYFWRYCYEFFLLDVIWTHFLTSQVNFLYCSIWMIISTIYIWSKVIVRNMYEHVYRTTITMPIRINEIMYAKSIIMSNTIVFSFCYPMLTFIVCKGTWCDGIMNSYHLFSLSGHHLIGLLDLLFSVSRVKCSVLCKG